MKTLLRRTLPIFRLDLCWNGKQVMVDYGEGVCALVGEASGVRNATEIMKEVEENMHKSALGMEQTAAREYCVVNDCDGNLFYFGEKWLGNCPPDGKIFRVNLKPENAELFQTLRRELDELYNQTIDNKEWNDQVALVHNAIDEMIVRY